MALWILEESHNRPLCNFALGQGFVHLLLCWR